MKNIDVLIVEDDDYTARLYDKLLSTIKGCTLKIVSSGEEALEALNINKFKIFILDINLGYNKLSGVDLSVEIRRMNPDAKIYVVTGFTYLFDTIDPSVAGINKVFKKPEAVLDIIDTIEKDLAI